MTWAALAGITHACERDAEVAASAAGWRELRSTKGHFAGGAWTPAVDAWDGDKHRAMRCLATHAGARRLPADRLRALMGAPDEVLRCPSAECTALLDRADWPAGASAPQRPAQLWLYHWRGGHDRLLFAFAGGAVASHAWLHDRE